MNTKDGKIFNQGIKIGVHNEREAKKKQKGFFAYFYYISILYFRGSCILCRKEDVCGDVRLSNQQSKRQPAPG